MNTAVLANILAEQNQVGNPNRDREREYAESKRHLVAVREKDARTEPCPVSHSLMAIHRLIQMD